MLACPSWGQTVSSNDRYQAYYDLLMMRTDTAVNKVVFYEKALSCSREYRALLLSTPSNADYYGKTQSVVKELYALVHMGAGFYSQNHQDSLAYEYAKMAVDLAMMKEMSDQGLRNAREYPSLVLFTGSRAFNAGKYEQAIKYLTEYIHVTDESQHPRVLHFLQRAESIVAQQRNIQGIDRDWNKDVPDFDLFAKESIRQGMEKWKQKDPYETVAEFKDRVNEENAKIKQRELQKILMDEYVQRFARKLEISDLQLKPYDADHQSFLIGSPYGDIVLTVPRGDNEARNFADNWSGVKIYNQNFIISNHKLALAGLTFTTPEGKVYQYDNKQALAYNEVHVDANFENLVDYSKLVNSDDHANTPVINEVDITVGTPDVDINIPDYKRVNNNTFAVIIANEHYTEVAPVPMAGNDGRVFAQYCEKTLGLPKENILQYADATIGKMNRAMEDIKNIANAYSQIRVIFYYAGHGIPDEKTHDAYLLPIDADGKNTKFCYSLSQLYGDLASLNAFSVVAFLDACFSGVTADGKSLMTSARGVALKPKQVMPTGNVVVFSAASGDETAYPYEDHGHGLFTYFLLKKLQDSKGSANLGDLASFIIENVKQKSVLINRKSQTPTVSYPIGIQTTWQKMKLR